MIHPEYLGSLDVVEAVVVLCLFSRRGIGGCVHSISPEKPMPEWRRGELGNSDYEEITQFLSCSWNTGSAP